MWKTFFFSFFYEARKKVILEMSKRLRRTITLRFCLDYFSPNILRSGREGGDFSSQYLGGGREGENVREIFCRFFLLFRLLRFFAHYLSFIVEDRPQLPPSLRKKEKKIKTQRKQTWLQKQKTNKQTNFSLSNIELIPALSEKIENQNKTKKHDVQNKNKNKQ